MDKGIMRGRPGGRGLKVRGAEALGRIPLRTDSMTLEEQTIERVDRTMTSIGNFLAGWDSVSKKPDDIAREIGKVRRFYEALSVWQADALEARGRKNSEADRVRRLRQFVFICSAFS